MTRRVPAVFLDKDGTLIENLPFNVQPEQMRLAPGAMAALRMLASLDCELIVVSNQPGVGLGHFPEHALAAVERRLREMVNAAGASLRAFYYCPHAPSARMPRYRTPCACRKPAPGLLHRAAREHTIDLRRSWMVGDILDDIEAGRRAGCRTVLIDNGNETEWDFLDGRRPHRIVGDLEQAARAIVLARGPVKETLQ
jgi:histidinol-phosphate phosphatase family protein